MREDQIPPEAAFVESALQITDDHERTIAFERGCLERSLCPMCIASGARGSCALDLTQSCPACGYAFDAGVLSNPIPDGGAS